MLPVMDDRRWVALAESQADVVARRQLRALGVTEATVRAHLRVGRWAERTSTVLTTTTGRLTWEQRVWVAVLHAGPRALVGGLTSAALHGLRHWQRDDVTVVVDDELSFDPVPGVRFFRSRRPFPHWRSPRLAVPTLQLEPAVLVTAAYVEPLRAGLGAIAATVQQRLSTPRRYADMLEALHPLRRSRDFRRLVGDLAGGAQSVAEIDVRRACRLAGVEPPHRQRLRVDRAGRRRYTDCEWDLPGDRVLVLEVDGAFHLEVAAYASDMRRQRRLTTPQRLVLRCSATELRHEPEQVMSDLIALGVPRTGAA